MNLYLIFQNRRSMQNRLLNESEVERERERENERERERKGERERERDYDKRERKKHCAWSYVNTDSVETNITIKILIEN